MHRYGKLEIRGKLLSFHFIWFVFLIKKIAVELYIELITVVMADI